MMKQRGHDVEVFCASPTRSVSEVLDGIKVHRVHTDSRTDFPKKIVPVFQKKHTFLMDLNLETMSIVSKCLKLEFDYDETAEYFHEANGKTDFRNLINGKKDTSQFESYTQVFGDKHGYLNNLSILDLLFNEGRYALDYLKKQE